MISKSEENSRQSHRMLSHEPDRFQIKYTGELAAYPGQDVCVRKNGFKIDLGPCDFGELDMWYFDNFNQLRPFNHDELCLSWYSKYKLVLSEECKSESNDENEMFSFVFHNDENSLVAQRDDNFYRKYLGVNEKNFALTLFAKYLYKPSNNNPTIFKFIIERPTHEPSPNPSDQPTITPSFSPTKRPSDIPSSSPSTKPSECVDEPGWVVGGLSDSTYFGWTCEDVEQSSQPQDLCSEIDAIVDATFQEKKVRFMA